MPDDINWQYLIIHHSATTDGRVFDYQAIKKYHTEVNGWWDIGYHFVVENVNDQHEVIVGRPLTMPGAHCYQEDMNRLGIGICFVGNYDIVKPKIRVILMAMKRIIIPLCKIYDIGCDNILGHGEVAGVKKTCPGTQFSMNMLRELVHLELK